MALIDRLESTLLAAIDGVQARIPRPRPDAGRLKACRIISHRGEHDNRTCFENTLPAFDAAAAAGVWGIELDIRWTRDLHPVVIHDPDLIRLHGQAHRVAETPLEELKRLCPLVPALSEVIRRYGGKVHLMVEIKQEVYPDPLRQDRVLAELFSGLAPGTDFHFMSLAPPVFAWLRSMPRSALIPIARTDVAALTRLCLAEGYGGLAGHYALISGSRLARLQAAGLQVGTGYTGSRSLLFREVNRGVDWIFSDRAVAVQGMLGRLQSSES
jgi:glycerophosphoryl diester phosphodiesterase